MKTMSTELELSVTAAGDLHLQVASGGMRLGTELRGLQADPTAQAEPLRCSRKVLLIATPAPEQSESCVPEAMFLLVLVSAATREQPRKVQGRHGRRQAGGGACNRPSSTGLCPQQALPARHTQQSCGGLGPCTVRHRSEFGFPAAAGGP